MILSDEDIEPPCEEINQIFQEEQPINEQEEEIEPPIPIPEEPIPEPALEVNPEDELKSEILSFSDYLDREYEALYPIVLNNDIMRDCKPVDHKVQVELERRLDLVDYIRRLFQSRIEKFFK